MNDVALGTLDDHPFVRVGKGSRTLLVVPGLNDALLSVTGSRRYATLMARVCERYADDRTVYVVSRPRGLSADVTTRRMARDYARVVDSLDARAVDVLGLSMGGFVVQHLAADFPNLVGRVVLGLGPARLSPRGRERLESWRADAASGDWLPVGLSAADTVGTGWRRLLYRAAGRVAYAVRDGPGDVATADFLASVDACLDHDATDRLPAVAAPTLVLGGTEDAYFSETVYRETADRLPEGVLGRLPGVGHEAPLEHAGAFDGAVTGFLDGEVP